jgi:four helix bundle protein
MRREIQDRAMAYAIRSVKLYQHLQRKREGAAWVLGKQYLRAATSIGANLVEAESGESRRDFIHKCSIAQKEARECTYWLTLLLKAGLASEAQLAGLIDETNQLTAILTRIIVNAKKALKPQ